MGKVSDTIDEATKSFIEEQKLFFVSTAPSGTEGHVNCSPKGLDTFRILDSETAAYVDYVGSGVETIAHLQDNGRIVVMFCAFDGPPKIVRLHGKGDFVSPADSEFEGLMARFDVEERLGVRAVIKIRVSRVSHSCGFGVPLYRFEGPRDQIQAWAQKKGADGVEAYQQEKNLESIDGLPGISRS